MKRVTMAGAGAGYASDDLDSAGHDHGEGGTESRHGATSASVTRRPQAGGAGLGDPGTSGFPVVVVRSESFKLL
jgi:hypothetical protein